jgi:hypothetical protein
VVDIGIHAKTYNNGMSPSKNAQEMQTFLSPLASKLSIWQKQFSEIITISNYSDIHTLPGTSPGGGGGEDQNRTQQLLHKQEANERRL